MPPLPLPRRLIVNADDFGLHHAINAAIVRGHRSGIITSASLMSYPEVSPAFADALALARDLPNLGLGLHFTLVGAPGLPQSYASFARALATGNFPVSRIETLLRRQLDALLTRGVVIDHLDSHQHLHVLPSVMRVICRVLPDYGISAIRIPDDRGPYHGATLNRTVAANVLGVFARRAARQAQQAGLWYPDHFRGMAVSGHLTSGVMCGLMKTIPEGVTEILCHPGADNSELSNAFDWGYDWVGELDAVTDQKVASKLKAYKAAPTTFAAR
jgi:predicted glycoside hydrolase/deacetylase ChbG (UPF0249 family)